jgi:hypothetical protein
VSFAKKLSDALNAQIHGLNMLADTTKFRVARCVDVYGIEVHSKR